MAVTQALDFVSLAQQMGVRAEQVQAVVALLDAGNTVPFVTRYRKDHSGGMDEEQVRRVNEWAIRARMLQERKQTILRSIESQGKLTPELSAAIQAADTTKRLEDLYLPYKLKKQTLATQARERGLQPLADEILSADAASLQLEQRAADFVNPDKQLNTAAEAILGAGHILAELFSERADIRQKLREIVAHTGKLASTVVDAAADAAKPFRDYFEYQEALGKIPPHRILAINRGERFKALRVRLEADLPAMQQVMDESVSAAEHPHAEFLRGCGRDALERLVFPGLERDVRRDLTDRAEFHAVHVFARNVRNLLLQPPVRDKRLLAIDPALKSGCKLVAIDEFGQVLEHALIHLVGKEDRVAQAKEVTVGLVERHQLSTVVIGNGTGCRETEAFIAELIAEPLAGKGIVYTIVNEAGASFYSTSEIGREELPALDATLRGAVSIGRRLQDPLSELVKVPPANIGVGMYQHDIKARHLESSLDEVVESCVNFVGVDVNTASPALLRYVSGLNQLTARRIFEHRAAHGPFAKRDDLKEVSGLGEATFVQAAGFLKIRGGAHPLDATWIHPESYALAGKLLERLGRSPESLAADRENPDFIKQLQELDVPQLAKEWGAGELTLRDIISQLTRPGRDPREDLSPPLFKREILKLEHLSPGMELIGTVLNVVDFGAFVDIGLKDTGLVHISQVANRYVPDPHEVVSVGDIVKVWVLSIDKERRRVSLTMIAPGTQRQGGRRGDGQRGDGQRAEAAAGGEGRSKERRGSRRPRPPKAPVAAAAAPPVGAEGEQLAAETGSALAASAPAAAPPRTGQPPRPGHGRPGQRPPQRRGGGGGGGNRPPQGHREQRPPRPARPAAPLRPLTKQMEQGKEPLRTFGDLFQFMNLKRKEDSPPEQPPQQ